MPTYLKCKKTGNKENNQTKMRFEHIKEMRFIQPQRIDEVYSKIH